jgi:hypothetical protein
VTVSQRQVSTRLRSKDLFLLCPGQMNHDVWSPWGLPAVLILPVSPKTNNHVPRSYTQKFEHTQVSQLEEARAVLGAPRCAAVHRFAAVVHILRLRVWLRTAQFAFYWLAGDAHASECLQELVQAYGDCLMSFRTAIAVRPS